MQLDERNQAHFVKPLLPIIATRGTHTDLRFSNVGAKLAVAPRFARLRDQHGVVKAVAGERAVLLVEHSPQFHAVRIAAPTHHIENLSLSWHEPKPVKRLVPILSNSSRSVPLKSRHTLGSPLVRPFSWTSRSCGLLRMSLDALLNWRLQCTHPLRRTLRPFVHPHR